MLRVDKGWGHELWIHNDEKYCGKLLFFVKGKKCSLHYHKLKHETFYVQSGKLLCTFTEAEDAQVEKVILNAGDSKEVPPGLIHQMEALEDTIMFEFSTQHFEEDSYRIVKGD
jgi:mannose-6-phosphate isomerase-like protein (cupin superfamily)